MKKASTGIVITVRCNSARLPNKCLLSIGGRETLAILIENVSRQKQFPVVVACPEASEDDPIVTIAERYGVAVYRGEDASPLHRLYAVALEYGFANVVRITADDILIDADLLVQQVRFHERQDCDYTWMGRVPEGMAGEVMRTSALAQIVDYVGDRPVEHVSYYFRRPAFNFTKKHFLPSREYWYDGYRLTLDYAEDLQVLRVLFSQLNGQFGTLDMINLLRKPGAARAILDINRMPSVTVYTCCYNQGHYLRDCLDSMRAQTFEDREILIFDDGSTDDTAIVAARWIASLPDAERRRTHLFSDEKNMGLPARSNQALHLARGRYVVRVDSDDLLEPEYVTEARAFLEHNRDYGAVFTAHQEVDEHLAFLRRVGPGEHVHPGGCMFRNSAARAVLYQEDLKHFEGLEFYKRFREIFHYGLLDKVLWKYRKHEKSMSAKLTPERQKVLERIG